MAVARIFSITDKTSGRDRICRLVQYGSKLTSWALEAKGFSVELVQKLKDLESTISTARKLFRLGKSLDNFRAALQTIHLGNPILRLIVTLIKLNRGLYLLLDHLIWAARMRFVNLQMSYWNDRANSFWMLAIFLSLLRDLYELAVAVRAEWKRLKSQSVGGKQPPSAVQVVRGVAHSHPALVLDVVKNGADLLIPSARLGLVRLSDGTVGLAGVVSSMAGLASMWKDNWKLIFS